jgi:nicotinate-nucleotide adenylyltransferase
MKQRTSGPRFGLFGGTFNPIHLGHLRAAEEVYDALDLERIYFIPSRIPPHKEHDTQDPIASAQQRLAWVETAIAGHENFLIDRIELDRDGPSYLVDTLSAIRDRTPTGTAPVFIVGEDAFSEMGDWREPERIFTLADFAVMTRPPGQLRNLEDRFPKIDKGAFDFEAEGTRARHREAETSIELVPITALDISSSKIRRTCRQEQSIRFLVPESIREQIELSGEYGPGPSGIGAAGSNER